MTQPGSFESNTSSAPSVRASARFSGEPAVATTRAPNSRATWIAATETPEAAAWTSTFIPGSTRALWTIICQAVRNVRPNAAPLSRSSASASGQTLVAGSTRCSVAVPLRPSPRIA